MNQIPPLPQDQEDEPRRPEPSRFLPLNLPRPNLPKLNFSRSDLDHLLWRGQVGPAFWSIASLISLTVNVILIAVLILLGRELFGLKSLVQNQLIGGLHENFVKMDNAHIRTTIQVVDTIQVQDNIPVVFDLPLKQNTLVTLTQDTAVKNATIFLNNSPVKLDLILKKGTELNIALDLIVPVNQTIPVVLNVPVNLQVPVDIDLAQTELHEPFVGLQSVVYPYKQLLESMPGSWNATPFCGPLTGWFCSLFLGAE
ncbi:MAG: hypothetical protein JXB15_12775 [Anaerolineales bacterium]|nr:hypothetical protein [Anaerolineales bacterium]